jgi:hypothetical protein
VALPIEEHAKLLELMDIASREYIDVKVVPDILQFIALRASLEELDGLPVINMNDVPLQGFRAWIKRSARCRALVAGDARDRDPVRHHRGDCEVDLVGPIFYTQERMGLDGRRSPSTSSARCSTTPRTPRDRCGRAKTTRGARRSALAAALRPRRAAAVLECAQGRNVDRRPTPERPFFVQQFRHRIPQYMLRHKVKARYHGMGAGQRLARQHFARESGSSTICITSKTGRSRLT